MKTFDRFFLTIFMLVVTTVDLNASVGDGSLSDTNIRYIGRWDKSNPDVYHSYWGGAYFKVSFTGKSIKIKLSKPVNIYVDIDKKGFVKYNKVKGTVNLTSVSLANGTHTLLVAANYANDEIQFQGLILGKGEKTVPQPKGDLVEFIGNSITTGQKTTKGDLSAYAWLSAEALNIDHTQISYPGITLVNGYSYDGDWAPKRGQGVQYFLMKQPNHKVNSAWDFKSYTPKIVVINLGTNDHNLKVPKEIFHGKYHEFLKKIRSKFPEAEIVAMQTFAGYYAAETKNAVKKRKNEGDTKVHFIDTTGWLSAPADFVDGTHPNDDAHRKAAKRLSVLLKKYLKKS